jgi:hypothetical protein
MEELAMNAPDTESEANDWRDDYALELWKYFGGVGAADKNTMVTVESLLLGVSAALSGYIGTKVVHLNSLTTFQPYEGIYLSVIGLVIAALAGYVALLYGGYSNWNWARADAIARTRARVLEEQALKSQAVKSQELKSQAVKWRALLPTETSSVLNENATGKPPTRSCRLALRLGHPCVPTERLPPIFNVFTWLAAGSGLLYAVLLVSSVRSL